MRERLARSVSPERRDSMKRIFTLQDIRDAANGRKALIAPDTYLNKPVSEAFVFNFIGSQLLNLIERGLYVYEKPVTITAEEEG